eukprot:1688884-Pleurochrysis_carterae.AAC.1
MPFVQPDVRRLEELASEPCCVGATSAEGDGRVTGPSAASATAARDMYASPLSADVAAACVPRTCGC